MRYRHAAFPLLALAACDYSRVFTHGNGNVRLTITDAPFPFGEAQALKLTATLIELHEVRGGRELTSRRARSRLPGCVRSR